MESKIFIDINHASRDPQIVIHQKDSDDPRDKLISMLAGQAMPGVRDGYCRIERMPEDNGGTLVVITPVHPVDLIKHIPTIAKFAEENAACDTSGVPEELRKIIGREHDRPIGIDKPAIEVPEIAYAEALEMVDLACVEKLPHDLYKKWKDIMFDIPKKSKR